MVPATMPLIGNGWRKIMVKVWILLIQVSTYNGYMIDDFNTEEECQIARHKVYENFKSWNNFTSVCFSKSKILK